MTTTTTTLPTAPSTLLGSQEGPTYTRPAAIAHDLTWAGIHDTDLQPIIDLGVSPVTTDALALACCPGAHLDPNLWTLAQHLIASSSTPEDTAYLLTDDISLCHELHRRDVNLATIGDLLMVANLTHVIDCLDHGLSTSDLEASDLGIWEYTDDDVNEAIFALNPPAHLLLALLNDTSSGIDAGRELRSAGFNWDDIATMYNVHPTLESAADTLDVTPDPGGHTNPDPTLLNPNERRTALLISLHADWTFAAAATFTTTITGHPWEDTFLTLLAENNDGRGANDAAVILAARALENDPTLSTPAASASQRPLSIRDRAILRRVHVPETHLDPIVAAAHALGRPIDDRICELAKQIHRLAPAAPATITNAAITLDDVMDPHIARQEAASVFITTWAAYAGGQPWVPDLMARLRETAPTEPSLGAYAEQLWRLTPLARTAHDSAARADQNIP